MKKLLIISLAALFLACNSPNKNATTADTSTGIGLDATDTDPAIAANNPADVLPDVAKKFVTEHFPNLTILHIENKQSPITDGTVFEVELSDKTEIDFDKDGEWREVNAEDNNSVPTTFLSSKIQDYLKNNYANIKVSSVDKEMNHIAIDLANDVDLIFDKQGNFLRIAK